ncbi:helix-turn-helix domain-containing protein [Streptomyces sp. NPDC088387]|uniref:PucR family transcriptional regulator n=1 Tax=Streptomyces sp. NPDC088387 TaxID=3365859 RepID=UPI00381122DA
MPDPTLPPTPPVSLSSLLAREDLALRQIAGPADPGAVLHGAHTSEMSDPYPYLLGGELLLTAGVHIPDAVGSGTYFDAYVGRVVAAGGAALGFGVAPVHDTVPRALVEACEAHGLPLLEVPPQTTFAAVARAVWQLMAQARHTELRRVTEAQQSLAAAAARPDAVPSVLRQLAQRVGGRAVLYGPEGTEIAAAGRPPAEAADAALAQLARVVTHRSSTTATDTAAGAQLAAYALGAGQGFVLGIATPRRAPADHTIASVAAVLLALLTGEHQNATEAARSSALVRLLLGAEPAAVAPLLAGSGEAGPGVPARQGSAGHPGTGGAPPAPTRAAPGGPHARGSSEAGTTTAAAAEAAPLPGRQGRGAVTSAAPPRGRDQPPPGRTGSGTTGDGGHWLVIHARPDNRPADAVAAAGLGAALGSGLVDLDGGTVRILLNAGREPDPQAGWSLGVSAAVDPREWPAADGQAARALARARATRTPLVRHGTRPALSDLVPHDDAAAHARTLLAPVADTPALTETLRTWLSLHGSWDRTAVALSVHRNTVRQRIARCAALLAVDLDDPDVRMELWFALRQP